MKHITMIGYVWPEAVSSAAGVRSQALIRAFLENNWRVSFLSPSKENEFSENLKSQGITIATTQANDPYFDTVIRELNPDVVLFDRFVIEEQFSWRVKNQCPNAMRVVDTQDLHFLRRAREQALKENIPLNLLSEDSHREIASIYRSDLTLLVSDFEKNLLTEKFSVPEDLFLLSSLSYDLAKEGPPFSERKNFVFIGNFRHPPNYDGIFWLVKEIWPKILEKLPSAELHIYGAYSPKDVSQLHAPTKSIHFMGHAPNQYDTLQKYRVNLAPLRFGAGVKGKILDAWSVGTPSISTEIGAEGMQDHEAWGGLIAVDGKEFATKAAMLHEDERLWTESKQNGARLLCSKFSYAKNTHTLLSKIETIQKNLAQHRKNNFIGQMLWHHQFKSTTYFSKWIEAKNKRGETTKGLPSASLPH